MRALTIKLHDAINIKVIIAKYKQMKLLSWINKYPVTWKSLNKTKSSHKKIGS